MSLRARLEAFGIQPKKALGQNFLHDPGALRSIARCVALDEPDRILEIGPGPGTLTDYLADLGVPVVAVEKDRQLVRLLEAHFANQANVHIVEGNFLDVELGDVFTGARRGVVVGNIPYSLSTPILLRLLDQRSSACTATVMLQAELSGRLRAPVGSRTSGSLTVLLALWANIQRILRLSPAAFSPSPKVRSEVIKLTWRAKPAVPVDDLVGFERLVRSGFAQRRKTLRNALTTSYPRQRLEAAAAEAGVDLQRRAETLQLNEWSRLATYLNRCGGDSRGSGTRT